MKTIISDEILLDLYYWGFDLSSQDAPFPKWFKSEEEKIACLEGYMDFDLGLHENNDEVLKKIKRKIK